MADLITDLIRRIEDLEERLRNLEHHEFAIMQVGDGVPTHEAAEATLYWNYADDDLYVNHNGADGWGVVVAL